MTTALTLIDLGVMIAQQYALLWALDKAWTYRKRIEAMERAVLDNEALERLKERMM